MKPILRFLFISFAAVAILAACGYRNPYVYSGPDRSIYVTNWNNRTSQLLLSNDIYQSLLKWFQKSGSLQITSDKENADFILAGEIISIDLPSLTYGSLNTSTNVNLRMKVRYILKDLETGKVLMEKSSQIFTESYRVTSDYGTTKDNEDEALDTIVDDLAQEIYQKALVQFAKLD